MDYYLAASGEDQQQTTGNQPNDLAGGWPLTCNFSQKVQSAQKKAL